MKACNAAILILALAAFGCGSDEPAAAASATTATTDTAAPPLPADVATIAEAATAGTSETTGTIVESTLVATGEFVAPVRSELSPKMPGRVAQLHVDEGSRVRRGQPVLQLESDYVRLNLQAAEAEVARAKAARDEAARDLARKKELIAKDSIPRATYDRSQGMYDQAQAAHSAAVAQAALLRQQLADATLRSPVDGIVAEKRTDVGARLGDGGVAFVVVQTSPLKLRFQVPERYLGRLDRGDAVTARVDPYPNETFTGTIKTVGGVIDPKTRTMFAEAEFANRDGRLRPGLFARVETKLD
ncbi:MAG TPA: efflux RND transporter periplasmic adaptor subunit [Thermoanaerobaculia bacterium]|nr:efflux RND transporter periplasmic adaptor subunit [Thermoanaerobaculia bacterium]